MNMRLKKRLYIALVTLVALLAYVTPALACFGAGTGAGGC